MNANLIFTSQRHSLDWLNDVNQIPNMIWVQKVNTVSADVERRRSINT